MSTADGGPSITGRGYLHPFRSGELATRAATAFGDLAEEYGAETVMVVKRFPSGAREIESALAQTAKGVDRPRVHGLTAHARRVIEAQSNPDRILTPDEQGALLSSFLEDYEWSTPYLEQAARHESFQTDISRFVSETTWQGRDIQTEDPVLQELAAFTDRFHEWLGARDLLDRADVVRQAIAVLSDRETRERIVGETDAVLALEFEEFTAIDRRYLATLTSECDLVCLADRASAIQRTWNEPGTIDEYTPNIEYTTADPGSPQTKPETVATFLATGTTPCMPDPGSLQVIDTETFESQVLAVANEIERLGRVEGIAYDECAVVLRDSNTRIPETLRLLRNAGIPVSSATVNGLEHDPAARECYAIVSWCQTEPDLGWETDRAVATLRARVADLQPERLAAVQQTGSTDGLATALHEWIRETDLKHRIGRDESALEATSQFEHVTEILELARFVDDSPLVDATWERFCRILERQMQRAASDKLSTDLALPDGGVLVDAVRVLKNTEKSAVFLLNVVDREYPADPSFTSLFPIPHLETLAGYPAFTTPSPADVERTFPTADVAGRRPLQAYYAELSRRLLAVGARASTDRLYFGTFSEMVGGTGSALQPSRYLEALDDEYGPLSRLEHDDIHSHGEAVEVALSTLDEVLTDIRRAASVGEPVDLDTVETDFREIQAILDACPPDVERALRARLEFAQGAVRRE